MSTPNKMDLFSEISSEVIHIARFGAEGRTRDVRALARRMSQRYRAAFPEFATSLAEIAMGEGALRSAKRPMPIDADSRMALARVVDPALAEEPVLPPQLRQQLNQLISEHLNPANLRKAGLAPTKSAIFVGPPGVGKTMAAQWVAHSLNRPLVTLDLATSISSFLGKTGQNIRQLFDFAKEFDCVLLLDEVDAIGKKRADDSDLGELKRLVNVLLQELDEWPEGSLVLAATNHPDLLDPAIWRRFEAALPFDLPGEEERFEMLSRMPIGETQSLAKVVALVSDGMNHSEIVSKVKAGQRAAALSEGDLAEGILHSFSAHIKASPKAKRHEVCELLIRNGISQRRAADITGTSRNTVRKQASTGGAA